MKDDINVPSKSNKQKNLEAKLITDRFEIYGKVPYIMAMQKEH
jgi:hypothetical protein